MFVIDFKKKTHRQYVLKQLESNIMENENRSCLPKYIHHLKRIFIERHIRIKILVLTLRTIREDFRIF